MTGLHEALRAEHAVVFGYGVVGAHLGGRLLAVARKAEEAHRIRRDAVLDRLTSGRNAAPPAEPAYALPFPVTDRAGALKLAIHLEERAAAVWRAVLGGARGADRQLALDALVDSAVLATRWREFAGVPATVPLPGTPA
ncbi:MAG TPA: ferritin-like domain-containing protein [Micromonosporaceae bacterium]|nr:ferritin-like domain-containing protein [Micromonosporaceae bacterium]